MFRPTINPSQQKFTQAALGLLGTFCMSGSASFMRTIYDRKITDKTPNGRKNAKWVIFNWGLGINNWGKIQVILTDIRKGIFQQKTFIPNPQTPICNAQLGILIRNRIFYPPLGILSGSSLISQNALLSTTFPLVEPPDIYLHTSLHISYQHS